MKHERIKNSSQVTSDARHPMFPSVKWLRTPFNSKNPARRNHRVLEAHRQNKPLKHTSFATRSTYYATPAIRENEVLALCSTGPNGS